MMIPDRDASMSRSYYCSKIERAWLVDCVQRRMRWSDGRRGADRRAMPRPAVSANRTNNVGFDHDPPLSHSSTLFLAV